MASKLSTSTLKHVFLISILFGAYQLKGYVSAQQIGAASRVSRIIDARRYGVTAAGVHFGVVAGVARERRHIICRAVQTQAGDFEYTEPLAVESIAQGKVVDS